MQTAFKKVKLAKLVEAKSKTGRGTRKNIKEKQLINHFKKLKKILLSNKKFKITLKQKPLL